MARVMEHHAAASFTHCLSAQQTITYVGLSVTPDALEVELDGKSYITLNVPEGRARLIGHLGASGCSQRIVCEQACGAESAIVLALLAAGFSVGVVPTSAVCAAARLDDAGEITPCILARYGRENAESINFVVGKLMSHPPAASMSFGALPQVSHRRQRLSTWTRVVRWFSRVFQWNAIAGPTPGGIS